MLLPEQAAQILAWYQAFADVEGVARVVSLKDITANDGNLNVTRYVERKSEEQALTVQEALTNLQASLEAAYAAEDRLKFLLTKAGLVVPEVSGAEMMEGNVA